MEFRYIKFHGATFLLIGTDDGSITTEYRFRAGLSAIAYLTPEGEVMQDGDVIGNRDDVEFGETFEPSPMFVNPSLN